MSFQSKALGYFSGLNWYAVLAKALIIVGLMGAVHLHDVNKCKLDNANAATKAAQIKYVDVVREVRVRVPVIQEVEKKTTAKNAAVKSHGDKLDEANKSPAAGTCTLSADQLREFQELAKATQH